MTRTDCNDSNNSNGNPVLWAAADPPRRPRERQPVL